MSYLYLCFPTTQFSQSQWHHHFPNLFPHLQQRRGGRRGASGHWSPATPLQRWNLRCLLEPIVLSTVLSLYFDLLELFYVFQNVCMSLVITSNPVGEIGDPFGVTVRKWVGFLIGLHEAVYFSNNPTLYK